MDRIIQSEETYRKLFGDTQPAMLFTNPELQNILSRFIFGEVCHQGGLDAQTRELITIVVLATQQTMPQLRAHVGAGLNVGLTPEEIQEALYQCVPYIGFPKTLNAVGEMNAVFQSAGIALPLPEQGTVDEGTRFDKGLSVQKAIFGETIDQMRAAAPDGQKHIQDYLSTFCFGDIYTRKVLDLPTRELLTLCIISALGGCEPQVKAHVQGNLNAGNSKQDMVDAMTQCLPYMGFPRTLNAFACINSVIPEQVSQ